MTRNPAKPLNPVPVLLHWRDAVAMTGPLEDDAAFPPVSMYSAGLLVSEDAESITIIQTLADDMHGNRRHEPLTVVKGMLRSMTYLEAQETIEFKVKVTRKKAAKKKRRRKK